MDRVSDDVLRQIANGNGHTYRHEGKSMATELLQRREAEAKAAAPPNPGHNLPGALFP